MVGWCEFGNQVGQESAGDGEGAVLGDPLQFVQEGGCRADALGKTGVFDFVSDLVGHGVVRLVIQWR